MLRCLRVENDLRFFGLLVTFSSQELWTFNLWLVLLIWMSIVFEVIVSVLLLVGMATKDDES